jgi:hypothetical protein
VIPRKLVNPPERDENVTFDEESEISWRQWFTDFRELVWPMLEKEGFTFPEAVLFWRQEIVSANLVRIREVLDRD